MSIWTLFLIGLVASSIGFHKFVWFISLGYGFSMAAIGVALTVFAAATPAASTWSLPDGRAHGVLRDEAWPLSPHPRAQEQGL
jgi:hypothetical protein